MSPGARNYNLRAAPSSAMFPRCEHIVQVHDRVGWVERKRNPSTALQHGTPYAVIAGRALVEALTGRSSLRGAKARSAVPTMIDRRWARFALPTLLTHRAITARISPFRSPRASAAPATRWAPPERRPAGS